MKRLTALLLAAALALSLAACGPEGKAADTGPHRPSHAPGRSRGGTPPATPYPMPGTL